MIKDTKQNLYPKYFTNKIILPTLNYKKLSGYIKILHSTKYNIINDMGRHYLLMKILPQLSSTKNSPQCYFIQIINSFCIPWNYLLNWKFFFINISILNICYKDIYVILTILFIYLNLLATMFSQLTLFYSKLSTLLNK